MGYLWKKKQSIGIIVLFLLALSSSIVFAEDADTSDASGKGNTKYQIYEKINKKAKEDMEKLDKLESMPDNSKPPESIDEAADNISNNLIRFFLIFFSIGEEASIYICTTFLILGVIGIAGTRKAPALRKWFVLITIFSPLLFILINYGPAIFSSLN